MSDEMSKPSFEMALAALKGGKVVMREAWNLKKFLRLYKMAGEEVVWIVEPKKRVSTWSRLERLKIEDIMADDWIVLEEDEE